MYMYFHYGVHNSIYNPKLGVKCVSVGIIRELIIFLDHNYSAYIRVISELKSVRI